MTGSASSLCRHTSMISSWGPFQKRIVVAQRPSSAALAVRATRSAAVV
jgi:hypothetical protein